jgi:ABC-type phosphate/phosphonate transport system permease subunit
MLRPYHQFWVYIRNLSSDVNELPKIEPHVVNWKGEWTMTEKKEKQIDNISDDIKFVKELQLTSSYYTLLLFFAIIALFKIPGTNLKNIVTEAYWIVGVLTIFSLFYQIHIAVALWKYRNRGEINTTSKKMSSVFYTTCFIVLIVLVSCITFRFLCGV